MCFLTHLTRQRDCCCTSHAIGTYTTGHGVHTRRNQPSHIGHTKISRTRIARSRKGPPLRRDCCSSIWIRGDRIYGTVCPNPVTVLHHVWKRRTRPNLHFPWDRANCRCAWSSWITLRTRCARWASHTSRIDLTAVVLGEDQVVSYDIAVDNRAILDHL